MARRVGKAVTAALEKLRSWELLCSSREGSGETPALPRCERGQEELPGLLEGCCQGTHLLESLCLGAGRGEMLLPKAASSSWLPSSTTAQS